MSHQENADFLRRYIKGDVKALQGRDIILQGDALNPHVDDFEAVIDIGKYQYVGYTYWSEEGNNTAMYQALVMFAYGRESLLAEQEKSS
ncbi:hypothetical protein [Pseudomonas donghuensis]|uniref:Uncharacterized protein n=1 Tax=Pseudomonas donghuensis TaxID=1163398 RepID=A0AAQ0IN86_9PSED|nr:hypothetical protein [Pseudomonas donghuensis]MCP6691350.1 hypothetical protein [Pseudomonas donghuensis]MDF9893458.1 hypothetical protein [Pseudomonas vranovensis]QWE81282.1 hypothetical protein BV82_13360 [Pseudomonas donghuensis]